MKKTIITILSAMMLTLPCGQAHAQKTKTTNDYNLQKAYEALDEERDDAKALDLVTKQLQETPDNTEALILRVRLFRRKHEYSQALRDINHALKVNRPKKSEIANSTLWWWKASLYQDIGDLDNAIASIKTAYELAKKDDKENLQSISFGYAQALYANKDYDGADTIYRAMLAEDEADQAAMIGLARGMIRRGEHKEALELLDKCQRLDSGYAEVYRFKMQAHKALGELSKTIDSALDWYAKDSDVIPDSVLEVIVMKPTYSEAALKSRIKDSGDPLRLKVLLGNFYDETHNHVAAIRTYNEMEADFGQYDNLFYFRGLSYKDLGLYDLAIKEMNTLLERRQDDFVYFQRSLCYQSLGRFDEALADLTAAIEENPKSGFWYYRRGWCHELSGDDAKAMEDYNTSIELDDSNAYSHLMRGELLLKQGKDGTPDFERVLQLDTVVQDASCRQYALHFLGRDKEAEDWMDQIIAAFPGESGNYYDKACLMARMGRLGESVAALRTAFEKGFIDFGHIRYDDDMDPIRDLPEFKALIDEYSAKHQEFLKEYDLASPEEGGDPVVTEIAMTRNPGGTFEIPCDINGLPLKMIFDTGASDVTISSVEANFMFKNGYLSDKDIRGKKYYQIANGQLSEGTVITLREVKVGDAVLRNVDASVVKSQRAPLLLGQSVMERFGTITIDNQNNKLIIKH